MKNIRTMLTFLLMLSVAPFAMAAPAVGVVLATTGVVNILRDNAQLVGQRKMVLQEYDEIRTGDSARAQLRFNDGTVTTLGANTAFRVKQFQWQDKSPDQASASFELLQGAFLTVTGHLLDVDGSQFAVITPAGMLGIRGTEFWGGYLEPGSVDVLLLKGDHAVSITNQSGTVLLQHPSEGTTLKADQGGLQVKIWPSEKVARAVATVTWPEGAAEKLE